MADKPVKVPEWGSDDSNNTEPAEAQKDTGWTVNQKPIPSSAFNWWMNLVWKWIVWLDDRVTNTGGTAPRIGFRGIGSTGEANGSGIDATGQGTGRGVNGTGGGTDATGVKGTGGATNGKGVEGQGTGSGTGVEGTGGTTSGIGVRGVGGAPNGDGGSFLGDGTGEGVDSTGGDTSGTGVKGTGGAPDGKGVDGVGTGSGSGVRGTGGSTAGAMGGEFIGGSTNGVGVKGTGVGSGHGVHGLGVDGYGVVAESDTSTPAKAALRLVGQDTAPSSPDEGAVYYDSAKRRSYIYDGVLWRPFPERITAFNKTSAQAAFSTVHTYVAGNKTGGVNDPNRNIFVKAGQLEVGTAIKFRVWGICTSTVANWVAVGLTCGPLGTDADPHMFSGIICTAATGGGASFMLEWVSVIESLGASIGICSHALINTESLTAGINSSSLNDHATDIGTAGGNSAVDNYIGAYMYTQAATTTLLIRGGEMEVIF